jgi:mRNA interferase MazF
MATSSRAPKRWDVVVVPFPYSDQLAEKRRPALVVSSNKFNRKHGLLWVSMITSASNPKWDGDVAIPANRRTGLPSPSMVRTAKIATIEPGRILRIAGRIDKRTAAAVQRELFNVMEMARRN